MTIRLSLGLRPVFLPESLAMAPEAVNTPPSSARHNSYNWAGLALPVIAGANNPSWLKPNSVIDFKN